VGTGISFDPRPTARYKRRVNSPRSWGAVDLLALACVVGLLSVAGCVEPQSGNTSKLWCVAADPQLFKVLDDMEDDDGAPCDDNGSWSVTGSGSLSPSVGRLKDLAELEGDDLMARRPSLRGVYLTGTTDAGSSASLLLSLNSIDLTPFQEIQFWARSDSGQLDVRVNVATAATTDPAAGGTCDAALGRCGNHFGDPAMIADSWSPTAGLYSTPLEGIEQQKDMGQIVPDKDLAHTLGLEFRVSGVDGAATQFGLWIDDIQLKRRL
jgi:hypothetical protein